MYSNPFPGLRSAYLRAIARAWRDDEFQKRLVDSQTEKYGALDLLKEEFGAHFPWRVKLVIATDEPRPVWMPAGTRGWIGTQDSFTLYIPVEDQAPRHPADVLARYYQERPTPLGRAEGDVSSEGVPSDFAEFGAMTMRAVALAWEDAEFRERLLERTASGKPRAVNQTFQDYLDYQIPWNFSIHFTAQTYPKNDDEWHAFPPNEIKLILPQRPQSDSAVIEAVALAAYNGTGPQYPFTCG